MQSWYMNQRYDVYSRSCTIMTCLYSYVIYRDLAIDIVKQQECHGASCHFIQLVTTCSAHMQLYLMCFWHAGQLWIGLAVDWAITHTYKMLAEIGMPIEQSLTSLHSTATCSLQLHSVKILGYRYVFFTVQTRLAILRLTMKATHLMQNQNYA